MLVGLATPMLAWAQTGSAACERRFAGQNVIARTPDSAYAVVAADLDGDGDVDALSAQFDRIAWYENTDGNGRFGPPRLVTTAVWVARSLFTADFNGDGDIDIASASQNDGKIAWYENTDGRGTFGPQQVIFNNADGASSVFGADLDGDGDQDLLMASSGSYPTYAGMIGWFENIDGRGTFGSLRVISSEVVGAMSVFGTDIDGDGDTDVFSASFGDNKIAWYENTDGRGAFGIQKVISAEAAGVTSVFGADLDGDGSADILSASAQGHEIAWFKNLDGVGTFGTAQLVTGDAWGVLAVFAADLDGDGDRDVLSAVGDDIAWYENSDGEGVFGPPQVITTAAFRAVSVYATDVDDDGDPDVLSASLADNKIAWYRNEPDCNGNGVNDGCDLADGASPDCNMNGRPDECDLADGTSTDCNGNREPDGCDVDPGLSERLIAVDAPGVPSLLASDLDGDGDQDVVAASHGDHAVVWYPNTDGLGSFGSPRLVSDAGQWPDASGVADFDSDGDLDVLVRWSSTVAWYENTDGVGTFERQWPITSDASSVVPVDLDGDGDVDVLTSTEYGNKVAWHENTDGLGHFGPQRVIAVVAGRACCVHPADVDGDGDFDVLSTSSDGAFWYENTDGRGTFDAGELIPEVDARIILTSDLDGDGDTDLLTVIPASGPDGCCALAWHANSDGRGTFGPQRMIASGCFAGVVATDLDRDGDRDLFVSQVGCGRGGRPWLGWYENVDGRGTFRELQTKTNVTVAPTCAFAADLDGDGDSDILAASVDGERLVWYENTVLSLDCNDDQVPDECDIADGTSGDCDGDGVLDECESEGDRDDDGVPDWCDVCPDSQPGGTLTIHGCDTDVVEVVLEDGCTMTEALAVCEVGLRHHGDYERCVTGVGNAWKKGHVITSREYGRIASCAAQPRAGKTDEHGRGRPR